jgi:glyoxylase-like metal-dependent hydrolase (beta-lactamase superfamily II)
MRSIDQALELVREKDLGVAWVLDTHPHADHFMASAILAERTEALNAIGEKVREIADL